MEGGSTTCPFCKGTGRCGKCGAAGTMEFKRRWFLSKRTVTCGACRGSGKCELCEGQGKRPAAQKV